MTGEKTINMSLHSSIRSVGDERIIYIDTLSDASKRLDTIIFHARHGFKAYFLYKYQHQDRTTYRQWQPGIIGNAGYWPNGIVKIEGGIINAITGALTGRNLRQGTRNKYEDVINYLNVIYIPTFIGKTLLDETGIHQLVNSFRTKFISELKTNFQEHWYKDFKRILKWKRDHEDGEDQFVDVNVDTANEICTSRPLLEMLLIRTEYVIRMRNFEIKTPKLFCTGSSSKKRFLPLDTKGFIELFYPLFDEDLETIQILCDTPANPNAIL
jgi:hypothetical protein